MRLDFTPKKSNDAPVVNKKMAIEHEQAPVTSNSSGDLSFDIQPQQDDADDHSIKRPRYEDEDDDEIVDEDLDF